MINIFCGTTLFAPNKYLFDALKNQRYSGNNIFIVPDRYTLSTEKAIFDNLQITSAFDIDVLTLSRLANKLMPQYKTLSKTVSVMIVRKLLEDNKNKFKCFNKTLLSSGFAEDLFNTINQLKVCKITPSDLMFNGQDYLALKINDIALIYEEYQKYLTLNNLKDSADKLDDFEINIDNSSYIKNSNIYIANFDNMTLQGYKILEKLIATAKSVNIGVLKASNTVNSHIYSNDMYDTVLNICKKLNLQYNIMNCDSSTVGQFRVMEQNLFSYKTRSVKVQNSDIEIFEHTTIEEELQRVAIKIVALTKQGYRYNDFAVAVPSLDSRSDVVEKVFEAFDIEYFLDIDSKFSNTVLHNFILKALDIVTKYFRTQDIISFTKSVFVKTNADIEDFEDFVNKFSLQGSLFVQDQEYLKNQEGYQNFQEVRTFILKALIPFYQAFKNSQKISQYLQAINDLLHYFNVKQTIDDLVIYFNENDLKLSKILPQLLPKLEEAMQGLQDILGDVLADETQFIDIFKSGLNSIKLSTTPLSCDSVFVGDASSSMFDRVKVLFVVSANENELPYYKQDCGIITDGEIDALSVKYKIEPKIKTINTRERFKLFNLVVSPLNKLIISYHLKSGEDKTFGASWVGQIKRMFLVSYKDSYVELDTYNNNYNLEDFIQNLGSKSYATTKLIEYLRFIFDGYRFTNEIQISTLKKALNMPLDFNRLLNYDNSKKRLKTNIFFLNNTLSVSQIERFYECPFKHFVDYGLKLKPKVVGDIDNISIGNILHKLAQCFVNYMKNNKDIDVDEVACNMFDKILDNKEYAHLLYSPQNKMQLVSLKKEAVRLCKGIYYQSQNSEFKTILTEARFDDGGKIKAITLKVGKFNLKLVGAVDRIDTFKDYFRIIDYKTGNCDTDLSELYYGKKLQLYVYQKVVQQSLKLKPAGSYYFPVTSKYLKENEDMTGIYKLQGYTLKDDQVICASDIKLKEIQTSDIVDVKRNKSKKQNEFIYSAYSKLLTQEQLLKFADYAINMLKQAVNKITLGDIDASPLKLNSKYLPCEYCPYHGICRFDEKLQNKVRVVRNKVDINSIVEGQDAN